MELRQLLNSKTLSEIELSNDVYNIRKKYKKNELIEVICGKILNKDFFVNKVIDSLLTCEINLLKELITNNGKVVRNITEYNSDEYFYLQSLFIIDVDIDSKKTVIKLCDDILELIKDIDFDKVDNSKLDKANDLLLAMTNYYGVVSLDDLENTYNKYYDEEFKIDENVLRLEYHNNIISYYAFDDKEYFIVSGLYELEDVISVIVERQREFTRKSIELDELLPFKDPDYYIEKDGIKELRTFLSKYDSHPFIKEDMDFFVSFVSNSFRFSINELYSILEILEINEVIFEKDDVQKLVEIFYRIYDDSVLWINNGWTSKEFVDKYGKNNFIDYLELDDDHSHGCGCGDHGCGCHNDHECSCSEEHECHCHGENECGCGEEHECHCHHDDEKEE